MTDPTPPRGPEPQQPVPGRDETRPFAASVPPQPGAAQAPATGQAPAGAEAPGTAQHAVPAAPATSRRGRVGMGAAALGLLGVGVAVGVVVGQATADPAAADTGTSTTQTVPGGGPGQYGTPPDGGMGGMPGGRGDVTPPDGSTDDGTTDGTTDGSTGGGDSTT